MNKPLWIIVHTQASLSISSSPQIESVNDYHRQRGFPLSSLGWFVGYHYFIEYDGTVIQTRNDREEGAHCNQELNGVSMNLQSLGICLAGNGDIQRPSVAQENSLRTLLNEKVVQYYVSIDNVVPHRHFNSNKSCYGNLLSDRWARDLLVEDQRISIMKKLIEVYKKLIDYIKR